MVCSSGYGGERRGAVDFYIVSGRSLDIGHRQETTRYDRYKSYNNEY